jgi:hypothetical protein
MAGLRLAWGLWLARARLWLPTLCLGTAVRLVQVGLLMVTRI